MANMSYCRFENTSADLEDCYDAIENDELENLSDYDSCKGMSLSQYQRNLKKQHKNIKIQK